MKIHIEGILDRIYPPELQLNKANASDTEAPFWIYIFLFLVDLFYQKIYDKRDDLFLRSKFSFFWMGTLPVIPLMRFTFFNLFNLLECLVM